MCNEWSDRPKLPITERSNPMIRSPFQCPGTARSPAFAGRALINVSGVACAHVLRRDVLPRRTQRATRTQTPHPLALKCASRLLLG